MVRKHVLVAPRLRRPPREGFSWVDRRFLREHAPFLSREAILLYFFLAAVSDKHGLSFWGDPATAACLKLDLATVVGSRRELVDRDLIACEGPLVQVLALPDLSRSTGNSGQGPALALGQILRDMAEGKL